MAESQNMTLNDDMQALIDQWMAPMALTSETQKFQQLLLSTYMPYANRLLLPFLIAQHYFWDVERARIPRSDPVEVFKSFSDLMLYNFDLFTRAQTAGVRVLNEYAKKELPSATTAWINSLYHSDGEKLTDWISRQTKTLRRVTVDYPRAIQAVEPEFGFHFERGTGELVAETDRFRLYHVFPTRKDVSVRMDGKPILIIPPFVLGANILAFLPNDDKSYAHAFANQGISTYIRTMKDIETTPALQTMTGEDDALDTKLFCETLVKRHGQPVTLNGYCQGGFSAVCNILSGVLDGLVDALITCVSPMDGTRSTGLREFLNQLPPRFCDLVYGTKHLPNGNVVADGELMGWVYKIKSIEAETPLVAMFRDMMMLSVSNGQTRPINKTAAALNYWLQNERSDLPLAITRMSFASYTTPITEDGTLPIKLFNRPLNFKRINEKGIQWLICYGEKDDLVEQQTALAPLDYIEAEVSAFPKGHVAIATSWSNPRSACALHTRFGPDNQRGPVKFHLDLEEAMQTPPAKSAESRKSAPAKTADKPSASGKATSKKPAETGTKAAKSTRAKSAPKKSVKAKSTRTKSTKEN